MSYTSELPRSKTPRWQHVLAFVLAVVFAFLVLGDAFKRGVMIGPYDILSHSGLTSRANFLMNGDTYEPDPIKQMIPWTYLAWTQVHHGALPLWNPYSGLGVPLAFNWQSAVFSVPSLVGYAVPLRYAFTAGVVATLVIAGTGGYVLGRVLRLGLLGALTVMAVFELSGPLVAWNGYPQAQVLAWGGWIFAAALLIVRGEKRLLSITMFAVTTACAVYAGHPETLIATMSAALLLLVLLVGSRALPARLQLPRGPILKPVIDFGVALAIGAALSAPLLLPGAQLVRQSVRSSGGSSSALPMHDLIYLAFSNFDGTPVPGSFPVGGAFFYNETTAYVGVIAVVLALLGILVGVRARRPEAWALAVVGVVLASVVWVGPVATLANELPVLGLVNWYRALMPLALVVAALAGMGMDGLARKDADPVARIALGGTFGLAAIFVAAFWAFGRTAGGVPTLFKTYVEHEHTVSFLWPVIAIVTGLVVSGLLWWRPRWSTAGLSALLGIEVLSLLAAGGVLISSSSDAYPATAAVRQLQRVVGDARVGTGGAEVGCPLGILPDANILFGIHQVNMNEPIMPKKYFSAWEAQNHSKPGNALFSEFCPVIASAAQARQLGVSYVLEPSGAPGPTGAKYITKLRASNPSPNVLGSTSSYEDLYFVPSSGIVTLSAPDGGRVAGQPAAHLGVSSSSSGTLDVTVHQTEPGTVHFHVSDVPGWHATIDGRPLALRSSSEFDLRADVPPGKHEIELDYWPPLFSAGLILAAIAFIGIGCALSIAWLRTRRRGDPGN
jgi:Bacterial membrane protein YfhO